MIYVKKSILLVLFLTFKSVFIPIHQPFDIFTMTHPCHQPENNADAKQVPLSRIKNEDTDRKGQAHIK